MGEGEGGGEIEKKGEASEGDHKPSSVSFSRLWRDQDDGHLSRVLITQGLKRPDPFRLWSVKRNKFEWAFLTPARKSGTYLVLLQVGFT